MSAAATEHKAQVTSGWSWAEGSKDFVMWTGLALRWRFVGERNWRKINVIADESLGQTPASLKAQLPEIVAKLAEAACATETGVAGEGKQ